MLKYQRSTLGIRQMSSSVGGDRKHCLKVASSTGDNRTLFEGGKFSWRKGAFVEDGKFGRRMQGTLLKGGKISRRWGALVEDGQFKKRKQKIV